MKKLFFLGLALPSIAFGSGKFQLQGNYFPKTGNVSPLLGFNVYQSLIQGLAVQSWIGGSSVPVKEGSGVWANWQLSALMLLTEKIELNVGAKFILANPNPLEYERNHEVHVKISYKLWD